jgi:hypothetical protein
MSNRVLPNYETGGPIPRPFKYSERCPVNEEASLMPKGVEWQTRPMSPATMKHIYSEKPLNYEDMYQSVPMGTLYDSDFSQGYPTGMGRAKIIGGGQIKAWPLTNMHVFEPRNYSDRYWAKPTFISNGIYDRSITSGDNRLRTGGW